MPSTPGLRSPRGSPGRRSGPGCGGSGGSTGSVAAGLLIVGVRLFVPAMVAAIRQRAGIDPLPGGSRGRRGSPLVVFGPSGKPPRLDGRPTPELLWLVDRVGGTFGPGDRIFYEEGGIARPGIVDAYGGRRCGGLLPRLTGVEVIGGPFLERPGRHQLHPVRHGQALRPGGLGPRGLRPLRRGLPAGGDRLLVADGAGLLPGEPGPRRGHRRGGRLPDRPGPRLRGGRGPGRRGRSRRSRAGWTVGPGAGWR